MDLDATSLYPSAMWDEDSVYPKIESGFGFEELQMNDRFVTDLNNQIFDKDGNGSALLKTIFYNPPSLIFQHLPAEEKVENIEVNRVRIGYVSDVLMSVDIQKIVKLCGEVIEILEGGVIHGEKYEITLFKKKF